MQHSRLVAATAVATLPAWWMPISTLPADAASAVRITAVQYDSPGSDSGSNASLNAEWVRIKNFSDTAKSLTGWTLRDKSRHVYRFGTFKLNAGKSVRVHTGRGTDSTANVYWGMNWYVWNNDGDKATLKNASGAVVSTKSW